MKKLKQGKKTGLKYFNMKDLRSWSPCYDPKRYLKEDFRGNALTILRDDRIPKDDRLWVVLRSEIVSEKLMRLFAVWSFRQTLKFLPNQDERVIKCADTAEAFALGSATSEDLSAAESAAWSAQIEKLIEMIQIEGKERVRK